MPAAIDGDRLWRDLETLASYRDDGLPPYSRVVFGTAYAEARAWLTETMEQAGLAVRRDSAANVIGHLPGRLELPALAIGSHVDTVVGGGRFDGSLGVLAAVAVARALTAAGTPLGHSLEVIDFLGEEPNVYGSSTVGSRAMAGTLDDRLLDLAAPGGERLRDALTRAGADVERLGDAARRPGELAAYLELHIEQGPLLERCGTDVGVVSGIVGIERLAISFAGQAAHAGTTPISDRHDALAAAAETVLAVEALARDAAGEAIATVGHLAVEPNATNVVPGGSRLVVEARSLEPGRARRLLDGTVRAAREAASARGVDVALEWLARLDPARADGRVVAALHEGCAAIGASAVDLPSWAGHDASQLALVCPFGMLFAPCRGGLSHHPDEWVEPAWATRAAEAFLAGILALDRRLR